MLLSGKGYDYRKKGEEKTPYETFLKYTDEKRKLSKKYSSILISFLTEKKTKKISILDIGSGEGSFIKSVLRRTKISGNNQPITISLLEPSIALYSELLSKFIPSKNIQYRFINKRWENFKPTQKYDMILATHLYHFPVNEYISEVARMISLLQSGGILIFTIRKTDQISNFITEHKKTIFPDYIPKVSENIFENLTKIDRNYSNLETLTSKSTIKFPLSTDNPDLITLIQFFISYPWRKMKDTLKDEILEHIQSRNGVFIQEDTIFVFRK